MKFLRNQLDNMKKPFESGGRLHRWLPIFEGFETFLFTPRTTSGRCGVQIHDSIDLKRVMIMVVIALVPCLLFGMFNTGYQYYIQQQLLGLHGDFTIWEAFLFGLWKVLPMVIVSYAVGLGIEFLFSFLKGREIEEGFLVSGMLIPLIMPVELPLWMLAVSTAFAVIIGKEVFGGTGMNIWNPALLARAFAFFSYPTYMSGNKVWMAQMTDAMSGETILGQLKEGAAAAVPVAGGHEYTAWDMFIGTIPGSIGETSTLLIILGGLFLIWTGIASWKIIFAGFAGGALMAFGFNLIPGGNDLMAFPWWEQLMVGGFAFGLVFMATDPVSAAQTESGKWIYGFLIGSFAILIRVANPAYPEGMMLSILLMNTVAPTIDHYVVEKNIKMRLKRTAAARSLKTYEEYGYK